MPQGVMSSGRRPHVDYDADFLSTGQLGLQPCSIDFKFLLTNCCVAIIFTSISVIKQTNTVFKSFGFKNN